MGIKRTGDTGSGANQGGAKASFRDREQYAGDYRIIGTVWKDAKTMLGYALMAIPSMKIALRTEVMLKEMLRTSQCENAILSPEGKIVNTECSMERLFKFNPTMQVVANRGLQILAEIHIQNKHTGYRVLSDQGKTSDFTEATLLELVNADPTLLVNAKVVPAPAGGYVISAIKKPFKIIERERISNETNEVLSSSKTALGFQSRYIRNAVRGFFTTYLQRGRLAPIYIYGEAFRKKLGRFLREVVAVEFPATEQVVRPIYKVVEESVNHLSNDRPSQEDTRNAVEKAISVVDVFITLCMISRAGSVKTKFGNVDISQFTSMDYDRKKNYDGTYRKDWNIIRSKEPIPLPDKKLVLLMHEASKSSENNAFSLVPVESLTVLYKALHDLGTTEFQGRRAYAVNPTFFENQTAQTVAMLERYYASGGRDRDALKRLKHRYENSFRTSDLDFTTDVGLENLGLTLDHSRVGLKVPSTVYGTITLKYYLDGITDFFDGIPEEVLEQNINCYGDLRILYHMAKAERSSYTRSEDHSHIVRFAVLSICNPRLAEVIAPRLRKAFTSPVNMTLAEAYGVGSLSESSLLFYYSGGFFNSDIKIPQFARWGNLKLPNGNKISLLDMPEDLKALVKQVVGVSLTPMKRMSYENMFHIGVGW